MERSPFLPLPDGTVIGQVDITPTQLTVEVISTQPYAHCPACGNSSDAVHCRYQRTVRDVPCGGRSVVLRLGVRKFFAGQPKKGTTRPRVLKRALQTRMLTQSAPLASKKNSAAVSY
jgi:hypothetical protein